MENRKLLEMKSACIAVVLFVLSLMTSGCYGNRWLLYHDSPIEGQVVDAESNDPLENVIVVGMWELQKIYGQAFGGFANIDVKTTDKEGKFKISEWTSYKPWNLGSIVIYTAPVIAVYKPGYKFYWSTKYTREGDPAWPVTQSMSEEEKKKILKEIYFDIRDFSLNPVRLKRINTDEEIWRNFNAFETKTDLSIEYYSREQIIEILNKLEGSVLKMSEQHANAKGKILKSIYEYKKHWLGEGK